MYDVDMITYELAKEWNEAGFPQGGRGSMRFFPDQGAGLGPSLYIPTIEELLEINKSDAYTQIVIAPNGFITLSDFGTGFVSMGHSVIEVLMRKALREKKI